MSEMEPTPDARQAVLEKYRKGLVQVYTGNGKGKTTAAFGQALRDAVAVQVQDQRTAERQGGHLFVAELGSPRAARAQLLVLGEVGMFGPQIGEGGRVPL